MVFFVWRIIFCEEGKVVNSILCIFFTGKKDQAEETELERFTHLFIINHEVLSLENPAFENSIGFEYS